MKKSNGSKIKYILFGEEDGQLIGITIEGLPARLNIDLHEIRTKLNMIQTEKRQKSFEIISGLKGGKLTNSPLTVVFPNMNTEFSKEQIKEEYAKSQSTKLQNLNYFSGSLSTPIVFLGAICEQLLKNFVPDVEVVSHILAFGPIKDVGYYDFRKVYFQKIAEENKLFTSKLSAEQEMKIANQIKKVRQSFIKNLKATEKEFPVIIAKRKDIMKRESLKRQMANESIIGKLETVVANFPVGIGEPFFASIESIISNLLFAIPNVKGVEFGDLDGELKIGNNIIKDKILHKAESGNQITCLNTNGGIKAGISNGEDIVIKTACKLFPQRKLNHQYSILELSKSTESMNIGRMIGVIEATIYIGLLELLLADEKEFDDKN